jgi:uncharacterized protein YrrD
MDPRDANELMSMPVIATGEGRELGRVKDVLFDPAQHALLGLMIASAAPDDAVLFLDRARIKGIGQDAVTVDGEGDLEPFANAGRAREVVDSGIHLRGANVLTEGGDSIGKVDKVLVNEDGSVASYQVSKGVFGFGSRKELPPTSVISIGEDAVIVSNAARDIAEMGDDDDQDEEAASSASAMPPADVHMVKHEAGAHVDVAGSPPTTDAVPPTAPDV